MVTIEMLHQKIHKTSEENRRNCRAETHHQIVSREAWASQRTEVLEIFLNCLLPRFIHFLYFLVIKRP